MRFEVGNAARKVSEFADKADAVKFAKSKSSADPAFTYWVVEKQEVRMGVASFWQGSELPRAQSDGCEADRVEVRARPHVNDVLHRLVAWEKHMGGFEAPVWEDARKLVRDLALR